MPNYLKYLACFVILDSNYLRIIAVFIPYVSEVCNPATPIPIHCVKPIVTVVIVKGRCDIHPFCEQDVALPGVDISLSTPHK